MDALEKQQIFYKLGCKDDTKCAIAFLMHTELSRLYKKVNYKYDNVIDQIYFITSGKQFETRRSENNDKSVVGGSFADDDDDGGGNDEHTNCNDENIFIGMNASNDIDLNEITKLQKYFCTNELSVNKIINIGLADSSSTIIFYKFTMGIKDLNLLKKEASTAPSAAVVN